MCSLFDEVYRILQALEIIKYHYIYNLECDNS